MPLVKAFVQHNADLNAPNQDGETPLIQSIKDNASEEIVNALVSRKVRVNDADKDGNTALHWALLQKKYVLFREGVLIAC
jgi:ankyrin repeat protein